MKRRVIICLLGMIILIGYCRQSQAGGFGDILLGAAAGAYVGEKLFDGRDGEGAAIGAGIGLLTSGSYGRHDYGRHDYGRHDYGRHDYGRHVSYNRYSTVVYTPPVHRDVIVYTPPVHRDVIVYTPPVHRDVIVYTPPVHRDVIVVARKERVVVVRKPEPTIAISSKYRIYYYYLSISMMAGDGDSAYSYVLKKSSRPYVSTSVKVRYKWVSRKLLYATEVYPSFHADTSFITIHDFVTAVISEDEHGETLLMKAFTR